MKTGPPHLRIWRGAKYFESALSAYLYSPDQLLVGDAIIGTGLAVVDLAGGTGRHQLDKVGGRGIQVTTYRTLATPSINTAMARFGGANMYVGGGTISRLVVRALDTLTAGDILVELLANGSSVGIQARLTTALQPLVISECAYAPGNALVTLNISASASLAPNPTPVIAGYFIE
jgi:hypothetical protein